MAKNINIFLDYENSSDNISTNFGLLCSERAAFISMMFMGQIVGCFLNSVVKCNPS
jgi:hypothetical protein